MSLDAPTLDPAQLAAFRQQAEPIVAQERGLTPACRRKLAGIARDVGIAEEQIDAAVRSLSAEPEAPPNPQLERFRRRLRKDLSVKTKTIIGPTIQEQIRAKAALKYGLNEAQAAQVLSEVAAELGLTRITAGEATVSLAAQIDEITQNKTWLAREIWDRLRSAGERWGLAPQLVEELIDERLAANRQALAKRRLQLNFLLGLSGVGLAALAIAAVLFVKRQQRESAARLATADAAPAAPAPARPAAPAWWDVPLALDIAQARSDLGGIGGACDLLESAVAEQRAAGYERLIAVTTTAQPAAGTPALQARAASIAAACLALEPDEAAAGRLQAALVGLLPAGAAPLAPAPALAASLWSADTLAAALSRRDINAARKNGLASSLASVLAAPIDPALPAAELQRALRAQTMLAAYRRLTAAAAKEPAAVAARFAELSAASDRLPADERLRAETALLAAALPAAGSHWQAYDAALNRCVSASDPLPALRLLEAYRRIREPEQARKLAELLVLRAGVQPKSWNAADVVAAVRRGLGGGSAAASLGERWLALREWAAPALEKSTEGTTDPQALLAQTLELAHLTTLAMALAQGDAGLSVFDAVSRQPPELERAPENAPPPPAGKRVSRALTASEQRDLGRALNVLSDRTPARQVPRESALRALAELAASLPDLPVNMAEPLAAYLLAEKSPQETALALKHIAELKRWLHLRLAVADGLPQSQLPAEQQRELAAALAGESLPPDANLPQALLENAHRELAAAIEVRAAASAAGRRAVADAAAAQLQQTFLARARLLGAPAAAAQSPAAALELLFAPLAEGDAEPLANRQQALRYLAEDDLHLTAAWQRLLIEASARRVMRVHPQRGAAAKSLAAESPAAAGASVLVQLRDQERTLLQLWMLHAAEP